MRRHRAADVPPTLGARGAQNDNNHLKGDAQGRGRFPVYFGDKSNMKGRCFFPVRFPNTDETGQPPLEKKLTELATEPGVMHIVAWDREYDDNSGDYDVTFRITRGDTDRAQTRPPSG